MKHENNAALASKPPRLVMVDDNIHKVGGHYLELARLLGDAAEKRGFRCVLATHEQFARNNSEIPNRWEVYPLFDNHPMVRWSLSASGKSHNYRDLNGRIQNRKPLSSRLSQLSEWLRKPSRRPANMLANWKYSFLKLMSQLEIQSNDYLFINTADDFTLLALAAALHNSDLPPLNVHAIFHFSINDEATNEGQRRNRVMQKQLQSTLNLIANHQIHIHATTEELQRELNLIYGGHLSGVIPYPTRSSTISTGLDTEPCRAVLAGMARSEKGKSSIYRFLQNLNEHQLINSSTFRPCLQIPQNKVTSMVPKSLRQQNPDGEIELITNHLATEDYHQWIQQSGLGVFLYNPSRYKSRCSGVLLEMLCRGVPVIVPNHCWLSNQVNLGGGHGSIGYIYDDQDEIPRLMQRFLDERRDINARSIEYASIIKRNHSGDETIRRMGLL